jgi:hypothetical protein
VATFPVASRRPALPIWLALLLALLHSSHAFVTSSSTRLTASKRESACVGRHCNGAHPAAALYSSSGSNDSTSSDITTLTHSDIEWKLRPPEGTSRLNRLKLKLGANILRWDAKLKGGELPPVLCPRGGQAVLEAYYKGIHCMILSSIVCQHTSCLIDKC